MFAATSYRLIELSVAAAAVRRHFESVHSANHLPNNYPAFVAGVADRPTKAMNRKVRKLFRDKKLSWFASHPSTQHRVEAAKKLNLPGIFRSDQPAQVLFSKFTAMSEGVTTLLYAMSFGQFDPDSLQPTDQALENWASIMDVQAPGKS